MTKPHQGPAEPRQQHSLFRGGRRAELPPPPRLTEEQIRHIEEWVKEQGRDREVEEWMKKQGPPPHSSAVRR